MTASKLREHGSRLPHVGLRGCPKFDRVQAGARSSSRSPASVTHNRSGFRLASIRVCADPRRGRELVCWREINGKRYWSARFQYAAEMVARRAGRLMERQRRLAGREPPARTPVVRGHLVVPDRAAPVRFTTASPEASPSDASCRFSPALPRTTKDPSHVPFQR